MSIVVKNNMSAIRTLNLLNQNSSNLAKSLQKVSSGMRINGAADDSSGYAISERMRVQLRGLGQANRNTQNAMSLMRVAEGAVSSTVEILKTMKEKALNAANDSNTDNDRRIIQKELEQIIDQVDDNANVTFNGKYLVDGSHELPKDVQEMIVSALSTEWLENSLDLLEESYGYNFRDGNAAVKEMSMKFVDEPGNSALAWVTFNSSGSDGKTSKLELSVNMHYFKDMDTHDTSNVNGSSYIQDPGNPGHSVGGVLDRTIAHELTHAIMASSIAGMSGLPLAVTEGMAELTHGIDDQRNLIGADPANSASGTEGPYSGGYVGLRYMAKQGGNEQEVMKTFMRVLVNKGAGALDEAVSQATHGKFSGWSDLIDKFHADQASSDAAHLEQYCGIVIGNDDTGAITGRDAHGSSIAKTKDSIVPEGGSTKFWYSPGSKYTTINGLTVMWDSDYGAKTGDMAFQIGTKANQSIKVGFLNMTAEGLGLKDTSGKKVSVATREEASNAIRLFDQSISKALHQQTTIGSVLSRLEYTSNNIVTASENVQSSESTFRDADMAKAMTEYTRNNVLLQAAQSMLAQANQNGSNVLSLLQ